MTALTAAGVVFQGRLGQLLLGGTENFRYWLKLVTLLRKENKNR